MRAELRNRSISLLPESDRDRQAVELWKDKKDGHCLLVAAGRDGGLYLKDLGHEEAVCRAPINVTSRSPDPAARMISNFATAPFFLHAKQYRSVESFWQGLKFEEEARRRELAELDGAEARCRGQGKGYSETLVYQGEKVRVGTWEHWQLMRAACWAKFRQNAEAAEALLSTGHTPLEHRVGRDSRTIPGVIMAEIWIQIRSKLRKIREREGEEQDE